MIDFLKSNKRIIIFSLIAVLFLIFASCINWSGTDIFTVIYLPLKGIGEHIRYNLGNSVGGWALYIFLGLLPLIYPAIKIFLNRKFYWFSLAWVALCIFDYVMLYFFINPHLLENKIVSGIVQQNKITLIGIEVTFFILFLLCVLLEVGLLLKSKPEKSYFFAKIVIDVLIILVIFNACFTAVLNAKSAFENINSALLMGTNFNKDLNRFAVVFTLLLKFASAAFTVVLLLKCCGFIDKLKIDAFSPDNVKPLKSIIRYAKISVLVTLGTAAVGNLLNFALSTMLLNSNFQIDIPLESLLTVCLVIIFSEILVRAINLNEEQKLVI